MLKRLLFALSLAAQARAQTGPPPYLALGDSLGEGVQSADSTYRTQPFGYPNRIAGQLRVSFPLPLIKGGAFTVVGSVRGRTRVDPTVEGSNLAVAGADSTSILNDRAGTPIDRETDLVLLPRIGSQVEIAESLQS